MKITLLLPLLICSVSSLSRAQGPAGALYPFAKPQFFTTGGLPAAGYKLCSYLTGTNTPALTYTDGGLTIPNSNPIVLGSDGRPTGPIYMQALTYKFSLLIPTSTTNDCISGSISAMWTQDPVADIGQLFRASLSGASGSAGVGYTPPGAAPTTVQNFLNAEGFVLDTMAYSPNTFLGACNYAASQNKTLAVTQLWTNVTGCSASLWFLAGGRVRIAGSTAAAFASVTCPATQYCFDTTTNSGASISSIAPYDQVITAKQFGATGLGVTDDSTAIQAAINTAKSAVVKLSIPSGTYLVNTAVSGVILNITDGSSSLRIEGSGSGGGGTNGTLSPTIIKTTTTGADIMAAISVSGSNPKYYISGISFIGVDAATTPPCNSTATSGYGLRISGTATAILSLSDLYFSGFCGTGKAGLYIDNAEGSSLTDISVQNSDTGVILSGVTSAFSANTVNNMAVTQNRTYGLVTHNSGSISFQNLLVQSNYATGWYMYDMVASSVNACHMENNNTSGSGTAHGTYMDSTAGTIHIIEGMAFNGCSYNGASYEDIYMLGGGSAGIIGNVWSGGIASSAAAYPGFIKEVGTHIVGNVFIGITLPGNVTRSGGNVDSDLFCGVPDNRSTTFIAGGCTSTNFALDPVTVANLPAGNTWIGYGFAVVSDALAPVVGSVVTGGGTKHAFVWNDGANGWMVAAKSP